MKRKTIEELYETPKSRGFINHLIKAYLPINKVNKVFSFAGWQNCSICGHNLISLDQVVKGLHSDEFMKDHMEFLKRVVNQEELSREDNPIVKHITRGAVLAFTGKDTNTLLCQDCIKKLLDFTSTRLLLNDKNIVWITKQMQRDQIFDTFKGSSILSDDEKNRVKTIKKTADKNKMTMADLNVLQELKRKMEEGG